MKNTVIYTITCAATAAVITGVACYIRDKKLSKATLENDSVKCVIRNGEFAVNNKPQTK